MEELPGTLPAAFAFVTFAGLLMGVAPSLFPLYAVVTGTVAAQKNAADDAARWRGLLFSSGFVLGIATVDALIGAFFAFAGMVVIQVLAGSLVITNLVLALVLLAVGLALLRVIRVPWLRLGASARPVTSLAGAYALGIPFGLSTCPVCVPMVLPVLGTAAATGSPEIGAVLLFTFGVARGIPLVLAGAATGAVKQFRKVMPLVPRIERLGGFVLLIAAGYFLYHSAVYAGVAPPIPLIDY